MADETHYDKNSKYSVTATFKVAGVATDPTTITFTAAKPDATEENYTYPTSPEITRSTAGVYTLTDDADQVGIWHIVAVGTGAVAATNRWEFTVDPRLPDDLLDNYALITLEEAQLFLDRVGIQGTVGDEEDDNRFLAMLVNAFSSLAQRYSGRQWKPLEEDAVKQFIYANTDPSSDSAGVINLAPSELRSLTELRFYSDLAVSAQWVVTAPWLRLQPRGRTSSGTYTSIQVLQRLYGVLVYPYPVDTQVQITGDWGAGTAPDEVKYLVAAEVANAYARAKGEFLEDVSGVVTVRNVGPFDLSQRSMGILDKYSNRPTFTSFSLAG